MASNQPYDWHSSEPDHFSLSRLRQHAQALPDKPDYRTPDLRSQFHPESTGHFLNRQPLETPWHHYPDERFTQPLLRIAGGLEEVIDFIDLLA